MDATWKTVPYKAGPYYMIIAGEAIVIEPGDMTVTRKEGTGHLSRGGRGFIDLSIFRKPGLTTDPLKRKVIWTHREDIDGDAIEVNVECIKEQVAYLMGLPDERRPSIIIAHVDAGLSEGVVSEAFVAVDEGFSDETFENLYSGPGYPEYKQVEPEEYIPEFLRALQPQGGKTDEPPKEGDSEAKDAGSVEEAPESGAKSNPRWRYVDRPMAPTWPSIFRPDEDYRKEGFQYIEDDVHRVYRKAADLGKDLSELDVFVDFPEFALFLDAMASKILLKETDGPLSNDLARRSEFFRQGYRFLRQGAEPEHISPPLIPNLAAVLPCLDSVYHTKRYSGEYSEEYAKESHRKVIATISKAIQNPTDYSLREVATDLEFECVDCLLAEMGQEALILGNTVLSLRKLLWDPGDRQNVSEIAGAYSDIAWAHELQGEWYEALRSHEKALAGYRACKRDGGWFYSEDIADQAYCCAFITRNHMKADELLRECCEIYERLPVTDRSIAGLVRSYELLAEVASCEYPHEEETRLLQNKASSLRKQFPEIFDDRRCDAHLDISLQRYKRN